MLNRLGLLLVKDAPEPRKITRIFIAEESGQSSTVTGHMGRELGRIIEKRFSLRRKHVQKRRKLPGRDGRESVSSRREYELRGTLSWLNESVAQLSVTLRDRANKGASKDIGPTGSARIRRKWLPVYETPDPVARRYGASSRAVLSRQLKPDAARWAVKNLARTRVVAKALGRPVPDVNEPRTERDGVRALRQALEHGVTADEQFRGLGTDAAGMLGVDLDARVVKVGAVVRPKLSAKLGKTELYEGDGIHIHLSAEETVNVAVFLWGADDRMLGVWPDLSGPSLFIRGGGATTVSGTDGCRPVTLWPLPDHRFNYEAVIVVATFGRLEFAKLANPQCVPHEQDKKPGTPGDAFIHALAKLDLTRAAVSVLPYRVATRE